MICNNIYIYQDTRKYFFKYSIALVIIFLPSLEILNFNRHKNDIKKRAIECAQTSTPVKEAIQDKPTFSLHEYEIQETVGRGSYAVVKLAVHATTHKQVAVKIISKLKAPDDFLEKFLPREIEIARILSHKYFFLKYSRIINEA